MSVGALGMPSVPKRLSIPSWAAQPWRSTRPDRPNPRPARRVPGPATASSSFPRPRELHLRFSAIAAPLTAPCSPRAHFTWGPAEQQSFDALKAALTLAAVLRVWV